MCSWLKEYLDMGEARTAPFNYTSKKTGTKSRGFSVSQVVALCQSRGGNSDKCSSKYNDTSANCGLL